LSPGNSCNMRIPGLSYAPNQSRRDSNTHRAKDHTRGSDAICSHRHRQQRNRSGVFILISWYYQRLALPDPLLSRLSRSFLQAASISSRSGRWSRFM